ncbi:MAG: hypothetical protein B6U76_01455 [Desulfurococcales archaeon ex4484_217_2]|nr:MAG: hypothetical protein B6U76_01455 [Desulfurococcales archaeon ex4484_217_2]
MKLSRAFTIFFIALFAISTLSLIYAKQTMEDWRPYVRITDCPLVVPPYSIFSFDYVIHEGNYTFDRVEVKGWGNVEPVSTHSAKTLEEGVGKVVVKAFFYAWVTRKIGNETKQIKITYTSSDSCFVRVEHYAKPYLNAPTRVFIDTPLSVTLTVESIAKVWDVNIYLEWDSEHLEITGEGVNESSAKAYYHIDKMDGGSKTFTLNLKGIKVGTGWIRFWLTYNSDYGFKKVEPKTIQIEVLDKGVSVAENEIYLTIANPPYVNINTSYTVTAYVFTTKPEKVTIAVFPREKVERKWLTTQEGEGAVTVEPNRFSFTLKPYEIRALNFTVKPKHPGYVELVVRAVFGNIDVREDYVKVYVGGGFALPISYIQGRKLTAFYYVYGKIKTPIYVVVRKAEAKPVEETGLLGQAVDSRAETYIINNFKENKVQNITIPIFENGNIGYAVSLKWADSSLGFAESTPIPASPLTMYVTGFATPSSKWNKVNLVTLGFADGELKKVRIEVTVYERGERRNTYSKELSGNELVGNGFVDLFKLDINPRGKYVLKLNVKAEVEKKIAIPKPQKYSAPLFPETAYYTFRVEGGEEIQYGFTTVQARFEEPWWLKYFAFAGIVVFFFTLSVIVFLYGYSREAVWKIVGEKAAELAIITAIAVVVLAADKLVPAMWSYVGEIFGIKEYEDPAKVFLATSAVYNTIAVVTLRTILNTVQQVNTGIAYFLIILGILAFAVGGVFAKLSSFLSGMLLPFMRENVIGKIEATISSYLVPIINVVVAIATATGVVAVFLAFIQQYGMLLAVGFLALSMLPPFRRVGLSGFLFFLLLHVTLPIFLAPVVSAFKTTLVASLETYLPVLRSGLVKLGYGLSIVVAVATIGWLQNADWNTAQMQFMSGAILGGLSALTTFSAMILSSIVQYVVTTAITVVSSVFAMYMLAKIVYSPLEHALMWLYGKTKQIVAFRIR